MRKHGDGNRKSERQQRIRRCPVVAQIVNDDRQPRILAALLHSRSSPRSERSNHMYGVRADAVESVVKSHHTRRDSFNHGKLAALRDFLQRLCEPTNLGSLGKRNVNVVHNRSPNRADFGWLKLRPNGHLGLAPRDLLRRGNDLARNRTNLAL